MFLHSFTLDLHKVPYLPHGLSIKAVRFYAEISPSGYLTFNTLLGAG